MLCIELLPKQKVSKLTIDKCVSLKAAQDGQGKLSEIVQVSWAVGLQPVLHKKISAKYRRRTTETSTVSSRRPGVDWEKQCSPGATNTYVKARTSIYCIEFMSWIRCELGSLSTVWKPEKQMLMRREIYYYVWQLAVAIVFYQSRYGIGLFVKIQT